MTSPRDIDNSRGRKRKTIIYNTTKPYDLVLYGFVDIVLNIFLHFLAE